MQLTANARIGKPSFHLSDDQVATVVDLASRACKEAVPEVAAGMHEVPITIIVRKALRRIKRSEGLTNLQVRGEHEIENMAAADASLLGRIDISLQFLHQFGDEDAYVGIECKRVGAGRRGLNTAYVTKGVSRFAVGRYSAGHEWGFMLGYVLKQPIEDISKPINERICKDYGGAAALNDEGAHANAMAVFGSVLPQEGGHIIRLKHLFVDMTAAA